MKDAGGWVVMVSAVVAAAAAAALVGIASMLQDCPKPPASRLPRACILAAGNARTGAAWLAPDHPRREAALLLLARDAAWAPVCAKDPRAGERLRDLIVAETATPTASRADDLARELVQTLEEGQP